MLYGTVPSQCDPAAVPDSLGYAIRAPSVTWRIIARHASRTTRWPAEGHMNKVDSSSLASFTSPLYRLTTPAAREEQGTSLYLRYDIPPHAPRAGSAKEATSGVFAGPAWPDFASPAVASLGYP